MVDYFYTWDKQGSKRHFSIEKKLSSDTFKLNESVCEIYDLSSLSFQASFGFNHEIFYPKILNTQTLFQSAPKFHSDFAQEISHKIMRLLNIDEGKIFYTVSGAESVENALKIVRQIKNKPLVAAQSKSYHGSTLGAISVTGDWRNQANIVVNDWTLRIPDIETDPTGEKTIKVLEEKKKQLVEWQLN